MPQINPYELRDFRKGTWRKSSVSESLVPENSVSHSLNVNFDEIIGKAKVRPGTTRMGATVATNRTPLGLHELVTSGGETNALIGVYSGVSNGTTYYFTGSAWAEATNTVLGISNTAKHRFARLGGRSYRVNGAQEMSSSVDGVSWATTNTIGVAAGIFPSLVFRSKGRLLAAGANSTTSLGVNLRGRVYFSSVIDLNADPSLSWNINNDTGDWIDINPDDGSDLTGFAETSGLILIFKENAMYRLNTVAKTVDTDNIFPFGARAQEGIVNCQGIVYYFSGYDIRRTNGGFPEQISRLGVQDWIDAIPQSFWGDVSAGTDGINVYFSIGDVTLNQNQNNEKTYNNIELKFSPRDESWSVHSYADEFRFFAQYTDSTNGRKMVGSDTDGDVQRLNLGTTDNLGVINFELETQEIEFGNRAHVKSVSDNIFILTDNGLDSTFAVKAEDKDYKVLSNSMNKRVNKAKINSEGRWFTFKWFGQSQNKPQIFEGFRVENITDRGTE